MYYEHLLNPKPLFLVTFIKKGLGLYKLYFLPLLILNTEEEITMLIIKNINMTSVLRKNDESN